MVDLYGCGCQYEEIGNKIEGSSVKGYALKTLCAKHQTEMESNQAAIEASRAADQQARDLEAKRQEALTQVADAQIVENDKAVLSGKVTPA